MPELVKQMGLCLVCGNGVYADQEFDEAKGGICHAECL